MTGASAARYIQGGVQIISADGEPYGPKNKVLFCRCDASGNKSFCDATHINAVFKDSHGGFVFKKKG